MAECAIFILWNDDLGTALMENRPDLNPDVDAYWVYPGGKVELGETPEQAMIRECTEEIGVTPTEWYLLTSNDLRSHPRPGTKQHSKAAEGWRTIPFLVFEWDGDLPEHMTTLDKNQAELAWVNPSGIAQELINDYTCNVQIAVLLVEYAQTATPR